MASPEPPDFEARIAAARDGDRSAWELLYREHAPAVLGYLRAQRLDAAEDVLAEVWLQVVRDLQHFKGRSDPEFRGWILRMAHNRLVDDRRAFARRMAEVPVAQPPETAAETDPDPPVDNPAQLEHLFRGLPATQRAVLYLRYVLDLPQGEIAEVLGSTLAAVKMQQRRGIDAIAARLEEARR
ncbi:MAG: RNA polymerase sigma factor [Thermoleophilia bacterium]|nr:RNA polymerase sigma factor [Thermoleophilia bacterium]